MTDDYREQWQRLTSRWRRGRRLGLVHLLVSPLVLYLVSYPVTWFAPASWLISGEPVWYYLVAAAAWFLIFILLLLRDRSYACPRCGTSVRPFGGTDLPNWKPHPCPQCGLTAPPPPY